ncbi:MAG: pirin-like C-terminal cupin domain-containing protein [Candidatus Paceibacterota bacterium]
MRREGARCIVVIGKPLNESAVWGEPIVMNTEKELKRVFEEYENGTFIKTGK